MTTIDKVLDNSLKVNNCLEYQGRLGPYGYGVVWVPGHIHQGSFVKGKYKKAHRIVMENHLGRNLDSKEVVCHHCDNPKCVELKHLFLGTQADNVADMVKKGRNSRKLTEKQVLDILADTNSKYQELADKHKVSFDLISKIKRRVIWKHLENEPKN